jgi:hypothetical protein
MGEGRDDLGPTMTTRADQSTGFVDQLDALAASVVDAAARLGADIGLDPVGLLGERAALAGLPPAGVTSRGGGSRMVPGRDGWLALSLPRSADVELLPALFELAGPPGDPWMAVARCAAGLSVAPLVERARWLGLAAAVVPDPAETTVVRPPVRWRAGGPPIAEPITQLRGVRVVDLSSLWAGPLCGAILADSGAEVVKVESIGRPDGARSGRVEFFDLMNAAKRSVALDLAAPAGRTTLRAVVAAADVVVVAGRPRAYEQLGLDWDELTATTRLRVVVSITGYGLDEPGRGWIAFGDDAAVAGGLVRWAGDEPRFVGDAMADPLSGMVAAEAVLGALGRGGRWVLDVSMQAVAARFADAARPIDDAVLSSPGSSRDRGVAAILDADTATVLDHWGVGDG